MVDVKTPEVFIYTDDEPRVEKRKLNNVDRPRSHELGMRRVNVNYGVQTKFISLKLSMVEREPVTVNFGRMVSTKHS